ncbi:uncharacterized protein ACA1_020530 [Acanthamoeba castellanii str. Neff]|uniref:DUF4326 domain-containing protein n=1 Tax=Acanthamoeba castellanii (strain ATCC 30010 / Neff) TaxID=1257118 RepID=L8GVP7_ACACF|nr:uncharacterized protein ACA1_020530 [Acanthamoeba castellanii str. Neff]ELR17017.1 hypothetical protein ACA1_020530 [Acanthamoeba castellanii str. Neff]
MAKKPCPSDRLEVVRITHANKHKVVYIRHEWKKGGYDLEESKWANPYFLKKGAMPKEHKECLDKYHRHIMCDKYLYHALPELCGKMVGCWCKLLLCHGDVLAELLCDYKPLTPKKPWHCILENGCVLVVFDVDCVVISNEDDCCCGSTELEIDNLCEEDVKHVDDQVCSLIGGLFEHLNPTLLTEPYSYSTSLECDIPQEGNSIKELINMVHYMSQDKGWQSDLPQHSNCIKVHTKAERL